MKCTKCGAQTILTFEGGVCKPCHTNGLEKVTIQRPSSKPVVKRPMRKRKIKKPAIVKVHPDDEPLTCPLSYSQKHILG